MSAEAVRALEQPEERRSEWIWKQLLDYIELGAVIPVVGPGLLTIDTAEGTKLYHAHVAELLAGKVGVSADGLPPGDELNEVAYRHLAKGGRIDRLYTEIFDISNKEQLPVPEPLRQLASISPFQLFVTTTFAPFLERALNEVRFGGRPETLVFSYSLSRSQDLTGALADIGRPVVYHLFGKPAAIPAFAVTHEDLLEFMHSLHSETRHPPNLYKELQDHSLLILGSRFSNWMARFFLRAPKRERLLVGSKLPTFVVDSEMAGDKNLTVFLDHFSHDTRVFPSDQPVEFVAELYRRWRELHPSEPMLSRKPITRLEPFVFLSYASEDRPAAERIVQALGQDRVDVFFDGEDLRAGENWAAKLRDKIRSCSLFMPIVSRHVLTAENRYFRTEWIEALELFKQSPAYFSSSDVFLLPVAIDATLPGAERIPPDFARAQWLRLPDGVPTRAFVDRVKSLHRQSQQERAGAL